MPELRFVNRYHDEGAYVQALARRIRAHWLASGRGVGLEDLTLPGDRPVRETSRAVCAWLGWL